MNNYSIIFCKLYLGRSSQNFLIICFQQPGSSKFIELLIPMWDNCEEFCKELTLCPESTQSSLVQAIQKYPDVCCSVDGFSHVISQKTSHGDDEASRLKLLAMLCKFIAEGKVERNLNDYVPVRALYFLNINIKCRMAPKVFETKRKI